MAQPECPNCNHPGIDNIKAEVKRAHTGESSDIHVVYCSRCGHIYDVRLITKSQ